MIVQAYHTTVSVTYQPKRDIYEDTHCSFCRAKFRTDRDNGSPTLRLFCKSSPCP